MTTLDWPGLLRVGLREAGLRPHEFWALTPVELMLILGRDGERLPLSRTGLDALLRRYPDTPPPVEET